MQELIADTPVPGTTPHTVARADKAMAEPANRRLSWKIAAVPGLQFSDEQEDGEVRDRHLDTASPPNSDDTASPRDKPAASTNQLTVEEEPAPRPGRQDEQEDAASGLDIIAIMQGLRLDQPKQSMHIR